MLQNLVQKICPVLCSKTSLICHMFHLSHAIIKALIKMCIWRARCSFLLYIISSYLQSMCAYIMPKILWILVYTYAYAFVSVKSIWAFFISIYTHTEIDFLSLELWIYSILLKKIHSLVQKPNYHILIYMKTNYSLPFLSGIFSFPSFQNMACGAPDEREMLLKEPHEGAWKQTLILQTWQLVHESPDF